MKKQDIRALWRTHQVNEQTEFRDLGRLRDKLLEHGMLSETRSVLKRLILRTPSHECEMKSLQWSMLAEIEFRLEHVDQAHRALANALALDTKNDEAWEMRARSLLQTGDLSDACGAMKIAVTHAIKRDEERRAHLLRSYAQILLLLGRDALALHYRKQAQKLWPIVVDAVGEPLPAALPSP